jgi:hypothetical protein
VYTLKLFQAYTCDVYLVIEVSGGANNLSVASIENLKSLGPITNRRPRSTNHDVGTSHASRTPDRFSLTIGCSSTFKASIKAKNQPTPIPLRATKTLVKHKVFGYTLIIKKIKNRNQPIFLQYCKLIVAIYKSRKGVPKKKN